MPPPIGEQRKGIVGMRAIGSRAASARLLDEITPGMSSEVDSWLFECGELGRLGRRIVALTVLIVRGCTVELVRAPFPYSGECP